jgi:hypothetical protein
LRIVSVIRCAAGPQFTPKPAFGAERRPVGADPVMQNLLYLGRYADEPKNRWNFNLKSGFPD